MEQLLTMAGITWRLKLPEGAVWNCPGDLAAFSAAEGPWDHTLEFRFCEALPPAEGALVYRSPEKVIYQSGEAWIQYRGAASGRAEDAYLCLCRVGDHTDVWLKDCAFQGTVAAKAVRYALELEHQLALRGGFILHASWIRVQDRGILFTAPSGTGKSTQADQWCRLRGAELINGDRTAVVAGETGPVLACGIPFAGSSGVCKNAEMPIAAIVYLSQAPRTRITPLTGFRAFRNIWEGCSVASLDREDAQRCLQAVTSVLDRVPVYHLACTPDESAVLALEQVLSKGA